jgi:PHD/YefM family antitoxin component YafN of YafNO toxin-antitoxin module
MQSFTTVDLLRNLKTVTHAAARQPVGITQHRQVRFVLMAIEDFEQLTAQAADPRQAFLTADMPEGLREIFEPALAALADADDPSDG